MAWWPCPSVFLFGRLPWYLVSTFTLPRGCTLSVLVTSRHLPFSITSRHNFGLRPWDFRNHMGHNMLWETQTNMFFRVRDVLQCQCTHIALPAPALHYVDYWQLGRVNSYQMGCSNIKWAVAGRQIFFPYFFPQNFYPHFSSTLLELWPTSSSANLAFASLNLMACQPFTK